MGKFFGTDGIRAVAGKELTCELAMRTGIALGSTLGKNSKVLIGKDPRISSDMLESAVASGLNAVGVNCILLGTVPTPAVSYLVKSEKADAGIMISASHNSFEFNGIKIFNKDGHKLPDEIEEKIESIISRKEVNDLFVRDESIGITENSDLKFKYIGHIKSSLNIKNKDAKKLSVLIDCSNGSSSFTAEKIFDFKEINADFIFSNPNRINVNENCGSTNIEKLSQIVLEKKYDLGVAFDGDADRCLAVDECGNVIDGDAILAIFAKYMNPGDNAIVGTIMSNMGLKKFCEENSVKFEETKVGDRYVLENMLKNDYFIGGEQSGHIILRKYCETGDGELTALKIIEIMLNSGKKASDLNKTIKKYPQKLATVNIDMSQKGVILEDSEVKAYMEKVRERIGGKGRIVVRESGTEPKIRIMVEHESLEETEKFTREVSSFISGLISKKKEEKQK